MTLAAARPARLTRSRSVALTNAGGIKWTTVPAVQSGEARWCGTTRRSRRRPWAFATTPISKSSTSPEGSSLDDLDHRAPALLGSRSAGDGAKGARGAALAADHLAEIVGVDGQVVPVGVALDALLDLEVVRVRDEELADVLEQGFHRLSGRPAPGRRPSWPGRSGGRPCPARS